MTAYLEVVWLSQRATSRSYTVLVDYSLMITQKGRNIYLRQDAKVRTFGRSQGKAMTEANFMTRSEDRILGD